MIVRHSIKCGTCECPHTLRIQVGHESYQEHTFQCHECEEEIVVGMKCDQSYGSIEIIEVNNCQGDAKEGVIINLSSEFPIPKKDLHRDLVFPTLDHMDEIAKAQESLGVNYPMLSSLDEYQESLKKHKSVNDMWLSLKKGWSLTAKGKLQLAARQFEGYRDGFSEPLELQYILFDFCGRMMMPAKYSLFEGAGNRCREIAKAHAQKFQEFRTYFKANMAGSNLDRYFETLKEYFICFKDFSQTLTHVQHGIKVSDEYEASSSSFSKTKLFYGNAYETLTSNVAFLACINNVANGRAFDQFEAMDLSKYQTINKANRCNPFKDVAEFQSICACLDSTVRNASHHGSMKLADNGRTINYQSGGTGMMRSMSYLTYINQCNEIMLSCCALLALELAVAF